MAGKINPFTNIRQSQRMSNFVDESIPADLMLRAGLAKQGQQDEQMKMLNLIGEFDENAIKGGDTTYIDQKKDEVNAFVDANLGKDLTSTQAQGDVFKFARNLHQDKKRKNIARNYTQYQQLMADAAELKKASKLFDPSLSHSMRTLNAYMDSGVQGGDIGALGVSTALNLNKKEQSYFAPLKASGGEKYKKDFAEFQGLYFKYGNKGVSNSRVGKEVENAVADYRTSSEGEQALQIYEEAQASGTPLKDMRGRDIANSQHYLMDRLARTGSAFTYGTSTVDYNKGLNERLNPKKEKTTAPVGSPGGTVDLGNISYTDALEKLKDPKTTKVQRLALEGIISKSRKNVAETPKGIELEAGMTKLADEIPKPASGDFIKRYIDNKIGGLTPEQETERNNTAKVAGDFLAKHMPQVIQDKLGEKDRDFFDTLASTSAIGGLLDVNVDDPENPYVFIEGTDTKLLPKDFNMDAKTLIDSRTSIQAIGQSAKKAYSTEFGLSGTSDKSDLLRDRVNEYYDLVDAEASGTSAQTTFTWRTIDPTQRGLVEEAFKSANFGNMVAVNTNNVGETLQGKKLEAALANIGSSNVSVRVDKENRLLEVTANTGPDGAQQTFKLQEKPNIAGSDQTFDRIFNIVTGEQGAGQKAGAVGNFSSGIGGEFNSLSTLTGQYNRSLPPDVDPNITVKQSPAGSRQKYVMGDADGTLTYQDLAGLVTNEKSDEATKEFATKTFIAHGVAEGISEEKINQLATLLNVPADKAGEYPAADWAIIYDLLNDELSANSYDEVINLASLLGKK